MGLGTLTNRSSGQTILDTFFNDIHSALNGDFVGRDSSGVPATGKNLGTVALPWGTVRASSMVINGSPIDTSQITSPANRLISGKKRTTSNQPAFITPNGAAASAIIAGATTNLSFDVNGTNASITTDITISSLTLAPSSNNTATVNDSAAAAQDDTRRWGEPDHIKKITVSSMGSNISALIGKVAAFKIGTEYFMAYVESSTLLSRAYRGFFYNSSLAPLNRTTFSNSATITLMSLGWVFAENNGTTVAVSYTNPVWSYTAPSSPATNDYWYDLANNTWKRYDGASWAIINRTFIGWVVMDSTNCVAARCADFYAPYATDNTMEVEIFSTSVMQGSKSDMKVSVAGITKYFGKNFAGTTWNMTTNLATSADMYNATEQASTYYFLYVKDTGELVISDISPYIRPDLYGRYHPHNPWRCVARVYNDGSSNLVRSSGYFNPTTESVKVITASGSGAVNTFITVFSTISTNTSANIEYATSANAGNSFTIMEEGDYDCFFRCLSASGDDVGASLDSTQLTTSIVGISEANLIGYLYAPNTGDTMVFSKRMHLKAGQVIRHHRAASSIGTGTGKNGVEIVQSATTYL